MYANDLNPVSFEYLNINKKLNKVPDDWLRTFNLDARAFISGSLAILKRDHGDDALFHHYIMNLPATAVDFLRKNSITCFYSRSAHSGVYRIVEG